MWWVDPMWAGVVLILGLVAIRLGCRQLQSYFVALERRLSVSEEQQRLAMRDHTVAVELAEAIGSQRAEFEKARLLHRAAEELAAQRVANDPEVVTARVQGELEVIAARTAGRVDAARERGGEEDDVARIDALMVGYSLYLGRGNNYTFAHWLGDANVSGLSIEGVERLVESYETYVKRGNNYTFGHWFSNVDPQMFQ